jgi:hypothetical protein
VRGPVAPRAREGWARQDSFYVGGLRGVGENGGLLYQIDRARLEFIWTIDDE